MGTLTGGLTAFPDASPDDGLLEVGVVTAEGALQWARVLARLATGRADRSPLAWTTWGARVSIDLDHSTAYELDGGARSPKRRLRASVPPRVRHRLRSRNGAVMSTARLVPETRDLSGDDAWMTLRRIRRGRLLKDAFLRMRVADEFSHARSMALLISLVAVQGLIALVGLAGILGKGSLSNVIVATVRRAVPGSAGRVLTAAVVHADRTVQAHDYLPLLVGMVGALFTADDGDGPAGAGPQPPLRGRARSANRAQIRLGFPSCAQRRHPHRACVRVLLRSAARSSARPRTAPGAPRGRCSAGRSACC